MADSDETIFNVLDMPSVTVVSSGERLVIDPQHQSEEEQRRIAHILGQFRDVAQEMVAQQVALICPTGHDEEGAGRLREAVLAAGGWVIEMAAADDKHPVSDEPELNGHVVRRYVQAEERAEILVQMPDVSVFVPGRDREENFWPGVFYTAAVRFGGRKATFMFDTSDLLGGITQTMVNIHDPTVPLHERAVGIPVFADPQALVAAVLKAAAARKQASTN